MLDLERLIPPMAGRKDFRCKGQLYNTLNLDMAHGSWMRSSTIL
jgi:hypothetical protein